jgi:hypothetical protein
MFRFRLPGQSSEGEASRTTSFLRAFAKLYYLLVLGDHPLLTPWFKYGRHSLIPERKMKMLSPLVNGITPHADLEPDCAYCLDWNILGLSLMEALSPAPLLSHRSRPQC